MRGTTATVTELDIKTVLDGLRGSYKPVDYSRVIQIPEQRIIVAADVHVPYHDTGLLASLLERAQGFEAIVWLGDLMDNPTYSSWGCDDKNTTLERELTQVEGIIRLASRFVKRQYWSNGNHEVRYARANGYSTDLVRFAKMAGVGDLIQSGQLVVSNHPTLHYRDDWMLTHPAQFGSQPLKVPGDLAERFGKNIVSAHAHHWGQGVSPSGRYTVVETGCLLEPDYIQYVNYRVTTFRAWTKGYVTLEYGVPTMIRG